MQRVKILGVLVNGKDKIPNEIKKNEALSLPRPTSYGELRRFLGLVGWFREFLPNYAEKSRKLYEKLKSKAEFQWDESDENDFIDTKIAVREITKTHIAKLR